MLQPLSRHDRDKKSIVKSYCGGIIVWNDGGGRSMRNHRIISRNARVRRVQRNNIIVAPCAGVLQGDIGQQVVSRQTLKLHIRRQTGLSRLLTLLQRVRQNKNCRVFHECTVCAHTILR